HGLARGVEAGAAEHQVHREGGGGWRGAIEFDRDALAGFVRVVGRDGDGAVARLFGGSARRGDDELLEPAGGHDRIGGGDVEPCAVGGEREGQRHGADVPHVERVDV